MKKLCLKKTETLTEQTSIVYKVRKLLRKSLFVLYSIYTNIAKVEMFHVLRNKVALLTRSHSEQGTRNRHQRIFRKVGP